MEILVVIVALVIGILMYKFLLSVKKSASYITVLKSVCKDMDSQDYQNSHIREKKVARIEKVGLKQVLEEIILEAREVGVTKLKLEPIHFQVKAIEVAENNYIRKFSLAHGKEKEFEEITPFSTPKVL